MKWLFVLLLLGNLLFFAYTQLESPPAQVDWRSREVNAAQLRQVAFGASEPAADSSAPAEPTPTPSETPAAEPATSAPAAAPAASEPKTEPKPAVPAVAATPAPPPASPATTAAATPPKPSGPLACFAWRNILPADLPNARKRLAALQLGGEVSVQNVGAEGPQRFWVYIPPRGTLADAQKKAEELRGLGVSDFFVVADGSRWNRSVSLGLFSTREAAERRLEAVKQQGVRSAVMRERGEGESLQLLIRQVPKSARLNLGRAAMNFRGSTVSEVDC
ncbi:SPOR domain-containing protein [Chitinimonas taiwanensis]|uniref:Sporulation related domain-containing protein n=1 Tax=Chitinimonas taiwanensis DSM 18899 TaxID=1121279 RepID=A0A1K2HKA5_9NEIS|nr:SPOR domain-containing protein [Chitinimonas taiwanensis]SFZ77260.1 Sporulation related domain-containing protein [Chitinimonas taiwanensis DSM 18899]